jgi:mannose-6-phosphate isomerase-like protein (cupin superfamily)
MKKIVMIIPLMLLVAFVLGRLSAQEYEPSCVMCDATYLSVEEIQRYENIAIETGVIDQQMRSVDIGKANAQVAYARRGKLDSRAGRVAEHDLVTEVYVVLSGSATLLTGPDLVNPVRRAADSRAVMTLNGPGHNAEDVRNGKINEVKAGDVVFIPAGTGHEFTKIDDHISYLMVRIDPDKVVPLMDANDSERYLQEHGQ